MSGHWPPEWDDPEEEFPEGADQADTEAEARLSEVAAYLASVTIPAMPDAVESRISAALAAEAATRAEHPAPADSAPADGARSLGPTPARARVRRHRGGDGPRRRFRVRPQVVGGSLVTCLLLALIGFGLSHAGSSSSSSSAASGSAAGVSSAAASSAAGPGAVPSAGGAGPQLAGPGSSFVVTASGTKYQRGTLAEQVRSRLAVNGGKQSSPATVPAASASAFSAVPSQALRGCVLKLTGGTLPRLVDRATYEGEPAYVIATASRIWVVGSGCTAAKTEVIASVPLAS